MLAEKVTGTVLVVGTGALVREVELVGLTPTRTADDAVAAVVQGLAKDTSWHDLAEATVAINAGALWVACNVDPTLPTERGMLPGNGSLVAAVRAATGREPLVAGKPATPLMDEAIRAANADHALAIGDRLDTDIAGAAAAGLDSLLVLSGVETPADAPRVRPAADLPRRRRPRGHRGPRRGSRSGTSPAGPSTTASSVATATRSTCSAHCARRRAAPRKGRRRRRRGGASPPRPPA